MPNGKRYVYHRRRPPTHSLYIIYNQIMNMNFKFMQQIVLELDSHHQLLEHLLNVCIIKKMLLLIIIVTLSSHHKTLNIKIFIKSFLTFSLMILIYELSEKKSAWSFGEKIYPTDASGATYIPTVQKPSGKLNNNNIIINVYLS